jgi:DNA-binding CsgD family transcriptional regulator
MVELAMERWTKYPWNLYADMASVEIEETPLLAFDVNVAAVDQAVARLIPRERSVILMRYQQGLKFREIAEQLPNLRDKTKNVSCTRVQQLLNRAHRRLRVSPLAGSFLLSGVAAGQEEDITRKERQSAAAQHQDPNSGGTPKE